MRAWILATLVALAVGPAAADTVVLKDGRRMNGEVLREDDAGVQLKLRGITVSFARDEVASVERGEGGAPAASDDPVAQRFAATGVAEVDALRRRSRERLVALERAAAAARKDAGDADDLRGQLESADKRIAAARDERERLKKRYDQARADYDSAAAKCGSGG